MRQAALEVQPCTATCTESCCKLSIAMILEYFNLNFVSSRLNLSASASRRSKRTKILRLQSETIRPQPATFCTSPPVLKHIIINISTSPAPARALASSMLRMQYSHLPIPAAGAGSMQNFLCWNAWYVMLLVDDLCESEDGVSWRDA